MNPIYLDFNATTPILKEAADAMQPFLYEHFGNPSSAHSYGIKAKMAIEAARRQVAELLNAGPDEIVFTSGGTEANNMAIMGVAGARPDRRHVITSCIEHPAVEVVVARFEASGYRVTRLSVDSAGKVDPDELRKEIDADTALVSIMHANNELGTVQPIAELANIAHESGALFHTDAAQSVGKLPTDVKALAVDLLTVAGHKVYAPKGVGALFIKNGVSLSPFMLGADHEQGRRPGTESTLQIVGLGVACQHAREQLQSRMESMAGSRDALWQGLVEALGSDSVRRNGDPESCLPNTLSVSFRGVEANTLLSEVGDRVAASAGAACHSDRVDVSEVLKRIGLPLEWAMGTIRLTTGRSTTLDQSRTAVAVLAGAVERIQGGAPRIEIPSENPSPEAAQSTPTWIAPLHTGESTDSNPAGVESREIRLTSFTQGLGCACKLPSEELDSVLKTLGTGSDEAVLVGLESPDDAAVCRISETEAMVQTVDFLTPIVDDPYSFGQIAAANAMSDVYAMGAVPRFAMNIAGFPASRLPMEVLSRILAGAADKAAEAGVTIIGGHTITDSEPKFGLAVTGFVDPENVLRKAGLRSGDVLVLTKPIGTGVLSTAMKRGALTAAEGAAAIASMTKLNDEAALAAVAHGVSGATDVTGFGLLGHLLEMTRASKVSATLVASDVPLLKNALFMAQSGIRPGGSEANLRHVEPHVDFDGDVAPTQRLLMADAQTSGGLLVGIPESQVENFLGRVSGASVIGRVEDGEGIRVQADTL